MKQNNQQQQSEPLRVCTPRGINPARPCQPPVRDNDNDTATQPHPNPETGGCLADNFAAIDFETANQRRSSVCSIGVVVVRDGKIVDTFYSLIRPVPNFYTLWTTEVHGLTRQDTDSADPFPAVWARIEPLIKGLPLVAHNKAFDENCLRAVFDEYAMPYPGYTFHCTLIASRRQLKDLPNHCLDTVAKACGYDMTNHHHALADAEACARIAMALFRTQP